MQFPALTIFLFLLNIIHYSSGLQRSRLFNCYQTLIDSSVIRRPGDGDHEIRVQLLPPERTTRRRGSGSNGFLWPTSPEINLENYKSPVKYLPGREYHIVIAPKATSFGDSAKLRLESVYITAVPIGTPESQEIEFGKGRFSPTTCTNQAIGYIHFNYNFPQKVNFIWTSPSYVDNGTVKINKNAWNSNECLELRATIVPWHWHRLYFKNAGSLKHTLCPAADIRKIDEWSDYLDGSIRKSLKRQKSDMVKARSVPGNTKLDIDEILDKYNRDGDYYETEEIGSCSLQELPKPVRSCCACNTAIYRMIIQSEWQQQQHWRDWPTTTGSSTGAGTNGNPHWSEILDK